MRKMDEVAYQTDPFSKRVRNFKKDMYCGVQPRYQSFIAFTKFAESFCLGSKNVRNGLRILAGIELCSKGMGVEGLSGYPLVFG